MPMIPVPYAKVIPPDKLTTDFVKIAKRSYRGSQLLLIGKYSMLHTRTEVHWQSLYMQKSLWLQPTLTKLKMKRFSLKSIAIHQMPQNVQTQALNFKCEVSPLI